MSMIGGACVEYHEVRKVCMAEENGKKYYLDNVQAVFKVRKVKVDGCIAVAIDTKKCDFLFSVDDQQNDKVFFVELKGGDILYGLKQIHAAIDLLKSEFVGYRLEARVVSSRGAPNFESHPDYKRLLKQIEPTGGRIQVATNKFLKDTI
jgi:hypothetical protein